MFRIMQRGYAPELTLSGAELIRENNPKLMQESMDMLAAHRWYATVVTQDLAIVPGGAFTNKERWYGTEYHIDPMSPLFIENLEMLDLHPELHLPEPNDFIPKNFDIRKLPVVIPLKAPILLKCTPLIRLWHKKDDTFWVPKVNMYFQLSTPLVNATPANFVKAMLFVKLVKDSLDEEVYSAELAGLKYSLDVVVEGIVLKVEGYNDKALLLLERVIQKLKTLAVDRDRFLVLQEQLERQYMNFGIESPHTLAQYYMTQLLQERSWTYKEKLEEVKVLTPVDIQVFYPQLLSRLHINCLVHGNMDEVQTLEACSLVENTLVPRPLTRSEILPPRSVLLPLLGKIVFEQEVPNPINLNSAIEYDLQVDYEDGYSATFGDADTDTNTDNRLATRRRQSAMNQIITQIIKEPSFSQLRTKEQLGYIVQCSTRTNTGSTGVKIVVQSERNLGFVQTRIEHFLQTRIQDLLKNMTQEEFAIQVRSLIHKKLESDKNLKEETVRYWDQISNGLYDFAQVQEEVEVMRSVSLDAIKEFFSQWIQPSTRSLAVHMKSQVITAPLVQPVSLVLTPSQRLEHDDDRPTIVLKDVAEFRRGMRLSKAPQPVEAPPPVEAALVAHTSYSITIRSTL
ncbi:Insulinase (Peptidase M16) [Podila humilis]|nr:Insulinase (Peptidase M16) [Podila humilis]